MSKYAEYKEAKKAKEERKQELADSMKDRGEEMKIAALPKAKYRVMMVKKMSDRRLHEEMLIQMIKSHDTQRNIGRATTFMVIGIILGVFFTMLSGLSFLAAFAN